jgi:integrase
MAAHGLRHHRVTRDQRAGATVKVVQRLFGCASAAMTLDGYGHRLNDDLTRVADALGEAIEATAASLRYSESSSNGGPRKNRA